MSFVIDRKEAQRKAKRAAAAQKPKRTGDGAIAKSAGSGTAAAGAKAVAAEPDHAAVLEEAVRRQREAFVRLKAAIPALRAQAGSLRQLAGRLAGRAWERRRKDIEKRAAALEARAKEIEAGDEERRHEERASRYMEAFRWNIAREKLVGRKRKTPEPPCAFLLPSGVAAPFASLLPHTPACDSVAESDTDARPAKVARCAPAVGTGSAPGGSGTGGGRLDGFLAPRAPNSGPGPSASTAPSVSKGTQKAAILNRARTIVREYLAEFEGRPPPMHITQQDLCPACDEPLLLSVNGSLLVCPRCRAGCPYMDTTTASMCYGEEVEFSSFTYKKVHHFEDWLKKFQAKGSKRVEDHVMCAVMDWHVRNGITSKEHVQRDTVRKALRFLDMRNYYDYDVQITCRITGEPPPCMTSEQEEISRVMFMAIQAPFAKWRAIVDPKRRNFLSYSFCLHQFCLIHGWLDFLPHFTLLKGKDKLAKQLLIWRGICSDLDWPFIPAERKETPPPRLRPIAPPEGTPAP